MFSPKSSSFHCLNADRKLTRFQKRLWFWLNRCNNHFLPQKAGSFLHVTDFKAQIPDAVWAALDLKSSPSRLLSDLFWMQLPWEKIEAELGEIVLLDTGCGPGSYGVKLQAFSGNRIARYVGVDVEPHADWERLRQEHSNFEFYPLRGEQLLEVIPAETNMFVSQSAIEHFDEDLKYFEQIRQFIQNARRSVWQIHIFPSAACLDLYGRHGVRQYTPRTVAAIAKRFEQSARAQLFALGGPACNRLHRQWISEPLKATPPRDLREDQPEAYALALKQAIVEFMENGSHNEPAFYALLIQTHPNQYLVTA